MQASDAHRAGDTLVDRSFHLQSVQLQSVLRPGCAMGAAVQRLLLCLVPAFLFSIPLTAFAQPTLPEVTFSLGNVEGPEQMVPALKVLLLMTVLSIAPAILISMTSFTRIVVVLSFVRQAMGTQNVPPVQVILALSLMLTTVVMAPVASRLNTEALEPYIQEELDDKAFFERIEAVLGGWMLRQTRESDLLLFYDLSQSPRPESKDEVSLYTLVPAFMISELRTGFEMGFLLFLPFVLVDIIVASMLTSMGMVMLPPTMVSTPMKLLLFVVVDGWALLMQSVASSFS
ncbi:MAG: flagellar type III secretion system pore protein FliP [Myxococcota bacterium]